MDIGGLALVFEMRMMEELFTRNPWMIMTCARFYNPATWVRWGRSGVGLECPLNYVLDETSLVSISFVGLDVLPGRGLHCTDSIEDARQYWRGLLSPLVIQKPQDASASVSEM